MSLVSLGGQNKSTTARHDDFSPVPLDLGTTINLDIVVSRALHGMGTTMNLVVIVSRVPPSLITTMNLVVVVSRVPSGLRTTMNLVVVSQEMIIKISYTSTIVHNEENQASYL